MVLVTVRCDACEGYREEVTDIVTEGNTDHWEPRPGRGWNLRVQVELPPGWRIDAETTRAICPKHGKEPHPHG